MTLTQLLHAPVKIVKISQNTDEWLEYRKTRRTASETPIVMSLSPWMSAGELAMEKFSNKKIVRAENNATRHGHKQEPFARKLYEKLNHCVMKPCTVTRGQYLASLDGWSKDRKTVVEIKSPYSRSNGDTWRDADNKNISACYWYQVQHQLMVSGAERCRFFVYDSDEKDYRQLTFNPDRKSWQEIIDAWEAFIKKYA